eukprot:14424834-Heterocapsa_arctica.AAC.1
MTRGDHSKGDRSTSEIIADSRARLCNPRRLATTPFPMAFVRLQELSSAALLKWEVAAILESM